MAPQPSYDEVNILDIQQEGISSSLLDDLRGKLRAEQGKEKTFPTILLYDERGLKLFEDITFLEEYYLTNAEIETLQTYSDSIAEAVPSGVQIIELGSGNLRKVSILLNAFERAGKAVDYYALDLSLPELKRTLSAACQDDYQHVKFRGLHGTYDDGLAWLKRPENAGRPRLILSLGSSIGNFPRADAADFLKGFSDVLNVDSKMLIGLDACQDRDKVWHGYNDKEGKTREFYLNGLVHANKLFGQEVFRLEEWDVIGEYDEVEQKHQAFYTPLVDTIIDDLHLSAGERIRFEESYKYSRSQSAELWDRAGLVPQGVYGNSTDDYHLHLLALPPPSFPLDAKRYAPRPVPSVEEFQQLWAVWDYITTKLIPQQELLSKPIRLRNCCIFYLGHIPTFLDLHVSKAIQGPPTEPASFRQIFERGIDPDVDNPEKCHAHSEIPDTWPALEEILAFQDRVRNRVITLHQSGAVEANKELGRSLWLSFEHEAMHLETLLYMLIQSDKVLPPSGVAPNFASLAEKARREAVPNEWIKVPSAVITLGSHDPEHDLSFDRYFGWDNEKPERKVEVSSIEAQARALTNEDYARYLEENQQQNLPALWASSADISNATPLGSNGHPSVNGAESKVNGQHKSPTPAYLEGKYVKSMYGPVPLKYALDWPVIASYDELHGCAKWMGGRIPTAEEVQNIYSYVDVLKVKEAEEVQSSRIAAVNGHLSNNGVEESPPAHPFPDGKSKNESRGLVHQLFADLENCNVGFKAYHPIPITQHGNKLAGRGEIGGVWEWTSSVLEKHEGFEAMKSYPGYTADFFDGKHNVVLGGSWATHPRIAGRKTFVNWYQRNYPFAWAGARLVRDFGATS